MNHNPYSIPGVSAVGGQRKGSFICTAMFWLSCLLAAGMFGIAVNGGYQYWLWTSQAGIQLPRHILASSVWVAGSGIFMLYSAVKWRRQLIRSGAVSFCCALLASLIGPELLPQLV